MKQTFESGQTVYLPDGREAEYVILNGDQHLVRVIHEVEGSYDEPPYSYPSDKITPAQTVYASAPVEAFDQRIAERQEILAEINAELADARQQIAAAAGKKTEVEKAATKYPCIQQALDFIEGRITHVVKWSGHGGATIHTMPEAFEQIDTWGGRKTHEGMKLLSLFGTDEKGRSVGWGLHQYRDGSGGSTTQIWPARSEAEARAKVRELVDAALDAWRSSDEKWWVGHISVQGTLDKNPWLDVPADWAAHIEAQQAKQKAQKIARLREELAALEGEV